MVECTIVALGTELLESKKGEERGEKEEKQEDKRRASGRGMELY